MVFCFLVFSCSTNQNTPDNILHEVSPNQEYLLNTFKDLSSNDFQGRKVGTIGNFKAQIYIKNALIKLQIPPFVKRYFHPFVKYKTFSTITGTNVIAKVEGTTYKNEYIVLTAHFDHLGARGNTIYNGADDNASGTAALLALAKKIKQSPLKHSVIFIFTDGEESGLLGSKAFINQQKQFLEHIKVNINLDMIAGSMQTTTLHYIEKRLKKILPLSSYKDFKNKKNTSTIRVKRGFQQFGKSKLMGGGKINYVNASDHSPFNRAKIPFVYFGVGTHVNYHTKNDDFAHANLKFYLRSYCYISNQIMFIDRSISK